MDSCLSLRVRALPPSLLKSWSQTSRSNRFRESVAIPRSLLPLHLPGRGLPVVEGNTARPVPGDAGRAVTISGEKRAFACLRMRCRGGNVTLQVGVGAATNLSYSE